MKSVRRIRIGGFTLIEVVTTVVILALLASVAIPMFLDYRDDAVSSSEAGIVGAVRQGIQIKFARTVLDQGTSWPSTLDAVAVNQQATGGNPFFATVMEPPVVADWSKAEDVNIYVGPSGNRYVYDETTGRFALESEIGTSGGSGGGSGGGGSGGGGSGTCGAGGGASMTSTIAAMCGWIIVGGGRRSRRQAAGRRRIV